MQAATTLRTMLAPASVKALRAVNDSSQGWPLTSQTTLVEQLLTLVSGGCQPDTVCLLLHESGTLSRVMARLNVQGLFGEPPVPHHDCHMRRCVIITNLQPAG